MMETASMVSRHFALQLRRRQVRGMDPSFLWDAVFERMLERMQWVRQKPQSILVLGDSRLGDAWRLAQSYPDATVLEHCVAHCGLEPSTRRRRFGGRGQQDRSGRPAFGSLWGRIGSFLGAPRRPNVLRVRGSALPFGVRDSVVDLLWLNGMLHWWGDCSQHLRELRRIAKPGALLSFSLLGVDSFKELRPIAPGLMAFPDMHDLGDALVRAGWAEPVVDMDRVDLSWRQASTMLEDLRALGGNCLEGRFRALRGRDWQAALLRSLESLRDSDGLIRVQVELILGHAWRSADPDNPGAWKPVHLAPRVARIGSATPSP